MDATNLYVSFQYFLIELFARLDSVCLCECRYKRLDFLSKLATFSVP